MPAKREREEKEDDNASLNVKAALFQNFFYFKFPFQEDEGGQEDLESPEQTMTEGPVDFTVKCEEEEQAKEEMDNGVQPDMSDMAAFIASATAAVRNAGGNSFQVIPALPPNHPHPPQLTPMTNRAQLSAFWSGKKPGGGATEEPITPTL